MGKKSAKSGGASAHMVKNLQKKAAKSAPVVESDEESEGSGNVMSFDKKAAKDSDDEDDEDVFNLNMGGDDDEDDSEVILCNCGPVQFAVNVLMRK